ncbi:hypothetical protein ColTof4_08741 [Colletotrichum tofieldiae]|nr:hypothetical protein ColTof3_04054 [Colletotrichum tofieldiae]GKT76318.1 hypothetical protein ColTof4_08741 [Colletotrichum tofieldiae]GKT87355.1 hypothetical protein Ct61P_05205 [Colletotrichum tofieldiae]
MVIGDSLDPDCLSVQGVRAAVVDRYGEKLTTYGFRHVTYQDECQLSTGLTDEGKPVGDDNGFISDAKAWLAENAPDISPHHGLVGGWLDKKRRARRDPSRFQAAFTRACADRAFFVTADGLMGIGPNTIRAGDVIAVLFGGRVPYVLRDLEEGKYYFIGECHVGGFMNGEVVRKWRDDGSLVGFYAII